MDNFFKVKTYHPLRQQMIHEYLRDEEELVPILMKHIQQETSFTQEVIQDANCIIEAVRKNYKPGLGVDAFLNEYALSSEEGMALMCLAEALLRIPDSATIDLMIKDKIAPYTWSTHLGKSSSFFINAATWGLMLTGKIVRQPADSSLKNTLHTLTLKRGEGIVRTAILRAMKLLGGQFVLGQTIDEALKRTKKDLNNRYSFDMLGEAAITDKKAEEYFEVYLDAIEKIGLVEQTKKNHNDASANSISIKLSALHPRYEVMQFETTFQKLYERVFALAKKCQQYGIALTIDAEEVSRLDISLTIFEHLIREKELVKTQLGLAVQAYQKRAYLLIQWLKELATETNRKIFIRLVKGAYWDQEIKWAQEQGLENYPVFTRKESTDISYMACAQFMLDGEWCYPQFATHNALTVAYLLKIGNGKDFEFQRLHGMGDSLYGEVNIKPIRIYAPCGPYEDLLAYLVRRLLENGANTSFVHQIIDKEVPIENLTKDPITSLKQKKTVKHTAIPLPLAILEDKRINSKGLDLSHIHTIETLLANIAVPWNKESLFNNANKTYTHTMKIKNPAKWSEELAEYHYASSAEIDLAFQALEKSHEWSSQSVEIRAQCLTNLSNLLEEQSLSLMRCLVKEAGKTILDAHLEIREAVDFCRYYAIEAVKLFQKKELKGPTGEVNTLSVEPRGLTVCISPWNFPLAIFLGQITAALVVGNTVIAKPAEETPIIASKVLELIRLAGIPDMAFQLVLGDGLHVGQKIVQDKRTQVVMFTGSLIAAKNIQKTLAERNGPIVPLIAETGGQNVMIVDSTALPEQAIPDILRSAFGSAGQRCSALRILLLQDEIFDTFIDMLKGAVECLVVEDPLLFRADIGPLISQEAKLRFEQYCIKLNETDSLLFKLKISDRLKSQGSFFAPVCYEIKDFSSLTEEQFGPILHVARFSAKTLDETIDTINELNFGLTFGIHSRLNDRILKIANKVHVGNIYINRNIIGAVVGVQPFGGQGLSGTGPKAGGPDYLTSLVHEKAISNNIAAVGGNASLLMLEDG